VPLSVICDTGLLDPRPMMGSDSLVPGIWRVGICSWANKRAGARPESPSAETDTRKVRRVVVVAIVLLSLWVVRHPESQKIIVGARPAGDSSVMTNKHAGDRR